MPLKFEIMNSISELFIEFPVGLFGEQIKISLRSGASSHGVTLSRSIEKSGVERNLDKLYRINSSRNLVHSVGRGEG